MSLHCWAQTLRHNLRSVKLPMEYELNYIHDTWHLLHPPQFEVTNHAHTAKLNEAYRTYIEKGRFGWHHKAWTDLWRSSCLWSSFSEHSKFFLQQLLNLSLLVSQRDIIPLVTGVSWVKWWKRLSLNYSYLIRAGSDSNPLSRNHVAGLICIPVGRYWYEFTYMQTYVNC